MRHLLQALVVHLTLDSLPEGGGVGVWVWGKGWGCGGGEGWERKRESGGRYLPVKRGASSRAPPPSLPPAPPPTRTLPIARASRVMRACPGPDWTPPELSSVATT